MDIRNPSLPALALALLLAGCLPRTTTPPTPVPAPETPARPYVLLTLNYSPSNWRNLCPADDCAFQMSQEAFLNLCTDYFSGSPELCSTFHADLHDNGVADNSQGDADYRSIESAEGAVFHIYAATLKTVLQDYPGLNIALATPNKSNGGTVLQGFRALDAGGLANQQLADTLASIPPSSGALAHPLQLKETLYEAFLYLTGKNYIHLKNTTGNFTAAAAPRNEGYPDYDGCVIAGVSCDTLTGAITGGTDAGLYQSPFEGSESCVKLYALILAFTTTNLDNNLDTAINTDFPSGTATSLSSMLQYFSSSSTDLLPAVSGTQNMKSWIIADVMNYAYQEWAVAGGGGNGIYINDDIAGFETRLRNIFATISNDNSGCNPPE